MVGFGWWGCAKLWYNVRYEAVAQLQDQPVLPRSRKSLAEGREAGQGLVRPKAGERRRRTAAVEAGRGDRGGRKEGARVRAY